MPVDEESIETLDTSALLAQARQGDAPAFCLLVQALEARLLRQAISLCHDMSGAEDLVSETLVQAWKSIGAYNESCRLSPWLYSILLHRHQKCLRAARSRPIPLEWLPVGEAQKHRDSHAGMAAAESPPWLTLANQEL